MVRRYGTPPKRLQRYTLRPGVYAILPRKGRLLVTHQKEPDDEFQLPGGGVDPGECPVHALHREVFEETGWHISHPRRTGVFRRFVYMPEYDMWAEKLCQIYVATPTLRLSDPIEVGHTAAWLGWQDAADLLGNPGDRAMVNSFKPFGRFR